MFFAFAAKCGSFGASGLIVFGGAAALAQHHPDAAEGRAAFLERRPAEWAAYGS